ncbi:hypothetical protein H6P81_017905 [Aristolochia fimbriata]|uniref:Uncharacterized protein n=1 Tax=Aristolochia fimbriata TaxID=158543 RepID=A0AAV7E2L8_ARIFI|nr:hypothetical protein H6P81_017905 [Aristolochia fimbriata]
MVKYMDLLSRDGCDLNFTQDDIPRFRGEIAADIIRGHLNTRETEDDKSVVRKSKPILGELANAIDEGLYYYEQELRSNQCISRRTHYGSDAKEGLFPSSFRGHSHGHIRHGIIAESPPSNSVGFLVGYTPPENQGPMSSRLSASPHGKGILSGSSPPVGSMPKWVQAAKVPEVSQALSK